MAHPPVHDAQSLPAVRIDKSQFTEKGKVFPFLYRRAIGAGAVPDLTAVIAAEAEVILPGRRQKGEVLQVSFHLTQKTAHLLRYHLRPQLKGAGRLGIEGLRGIVPQQGFDRPQAFAGVDGKKDEGDEGKRPKGVQDLFMKVEANHGAL